MSEHEIFLARRSNSSKVNHGKFRYNNLKAEKQRRIIKILRTKYLTNKSI